MLDVIVRPLLFTALLAATFMPLEHAFGEARSWRSLLRSRDLLFATLGQIGIQLVMLYGVSSLLFAVEDMGCERSPFVWIEQPLVRSVLEVSVGLVLFELMGYAYHRLAHHWQPLWRLHALHHSSETLDWLASFRQHPLEILLMTIAQNVPLALLAIPLHAHAWVLLLLKLNTIFVHANLRFGWGPLQRVLASPTYHHHHHSAAGNRSNYAAMLVWIDWLFGTYHPVRNKGVS